MKFLARATFVDEHGQPLHAHVQRVLREVAPRLQRQFPSVRDEVTITDILEEAGRKIQRHEQQAGPIEKLHAYAWVTVKSIATSTVRRSSMRLARATLEPDVSDVVLGSLRSSTGTAEQIETDILLRETLTQLTPEERMICALKRLGFSGREIAQHEGTSVERVNTFFFRLKRKIRDVLREPGADASARRAPRAKKRSA